MRTVLLLARPASRVCLEPIPDKLVVLTFDDASKSHFTIARPLLKKHKFGATFFITEGWDFATNKKDYMTWDEIAQLHKDGFEIGNHTRDHKGVSAESIRDLAAQLRAINVRCKEHGIPEPTSFAYPGNAIAKEGLPVLKELGIKFARRGGSPEYPYKEGRGFAYEPGLDHPLLIPTAGDARPAWTLDDLKARRRSGEARQDRRPAIPRRAGHRSRLGHLDQGAIRGVPAIPRGREMHRHRAPRSGEIRRSRRRAERSLGRHRRSQETA